MKNISTDKIIAIGLLVALVISFFFGSSAELQTAIVAGLVGYLGKVATEHASTLNSSGSTPDKKAIVSEVMDLVTKEATQQITTKVLNEAMKKIGGNKDGHNSNT